MLTNISDHLAPCCHQDSLRALLVEKILAENGLPDCWICIDHCPLSTYKKEGEESFISIN